MGRPQRLQHLRRRPGGAHHHRLAAAGGGQRRRSSGRRRRCRRSPTSSGARGGPRGCGHARAPMPGSAQGRAVRLLLERPRDLRRGLRARDARIPQGARPRRGDGGRRCAAVADDRAVMRQLRAATRRGCRPASWRSTRATARCRAWVGSRDFDTRPVRPRRAGARQPGLDLQALRLRRGVRAAASPPTDSFIDPPVEIPLRRRQRLAAHRRAAARAAGR